MAWKGTPHDDPWQASTAEERDEHEDEGEHEDEPHEPPRGALLITCGYLVMVCALWLEVYLQLISNGGVPRP
jgi:hypothetical protein